MNSNLTPIRNFPVPEKKKCIRQFLGKINFYHKFIKNAAPVLEPFHNLLRKNIPFVWNGEYQKAFESVKDYLTSAPILSMFD